MSKSKNSLLGIEIPQESKKNILEKVSSWVGQKGDMKHVVSLNPEILVLAHDDEEFRSILQSADLRLIDGFGVTLASKLRGISVGERYTGVDFMEGILAMLSNGSSRVLFLGGSPNLAVELAKCYEKKYPSIQFNGITGIKNINTYQSDQEGKSILKEIAVYRPHIIFAAFGSPFQEKFFWKNKSELKNTICVGVGGAFDFLSGNVPRAPKILRVIGLEWLFRLILQPWRWKRQLRLIRFLWLVALGQ
jgi:N-acetylglucosaminyldiphosphoundecaprenol N-acetyl-beta-D-mannosaminyltransferase